MQRKIIFLIEIIVIIGSIILDFDKLFQMLIGNRDKWYKKNELYFNLIILALKKIKNNKLQINLDNSNIIHQFTSFWFFKNKIQTQSLCGII